MKSALRVLTATIEKRVPDAADVEALRQFAVTQTAGLPPDELACEVIQQAMKRRSAEVHAARAGAEFC